MMDMKRDVKSTSDREIVRVRVLNAPRELVFKTWTEPEHVDKWWGPRGFTTKTHRMDVKPGGSWHYLMSHAEHGEFDNLITYREVVRPERLVYSHGTSEEPEMFQVTVTFADEGGKTRLTMHSVWPTAEALEAVKKYGAEEGGKQTLDKMQEYVEKQAGRTT
ncbi:SRPBCC family protein [Archangium violaceum]|uniref:SRPBCC family protein n=1 Tax=Archangium violaceum TaxID=83451 RepID=UPI0036DC4CB4